MGSRSIYYIDLPKFGPEYMILISTISSTPIPLAESQSQATYLPTYLPTYLEYVRAQEKEREEKRRPYSTEESSSIDMKSYSRRT